MGKLIVGGRATGKRLEMFKTLTGLTPDDSCSCGARVALWTWTCQACGARRPTLCSGYDDAVSGKHVHCGRHTTDGQCRGCRMSEEVSVRAMVCSRIPNRVDAYDPLGHRGPLDAELVRWLDGQIRNLYIAGPHRTGRRTAVSYWLRDFIVKTGESNVWWTTEVAILDAIVGCRSWDPEERRTHAMVVDQVRCSRILVVEGLGERGRVGADERAIRRLSELLGERFRGHWFKTCIISAVEPSRASAFYGEDLTAYGSEVRVMSPDITKSMGYAG